MYFILGVILLLSSCQGLGSLTLSFKEQLSVYFCLFIRKAEQLTAYKILELLITEKLRFYFILYTLYFHRYYFVKALRIICSKIVLKALCTYSRQSLVAFLTGSRSHCYPKNIAATKEGFCRSEASDPYTYSCP